MKIILMLSFLLMSIHANSQTEDLAIDTLMQIAHIRKTYQYIQDNRINFEKKLDTNNFESENSDEKYERVYYYENNQLRLVTELSETNTYSAGVASISASELYFWDNELIFYYNRNYQQTREEFCEYYQVLPYEAKELRYYYSKKNLIQLLEKEIKSETKMKFDELSDIFSKMMNTKMPVSENSNYGSLIYNFRIEQYMNK